MESDLVVCVCVCISTAHLLTACHSTVYLPVISSLPVSPQCSAKSCRTAFHVTCGQRAGLKMSTILTEADEVKFKSFCPEHSGLKMADGAVVKEEEEEAEGAERGEESGRRSGRKSREPNPTPRPAPDPPHAGGVARPSERKQRLQQLEDEFYRFVSAGDVAKRLGLPWETVDFAFQYWKLKRRANFNQPLITPKREEEESLARREQEVLLRRLRLFTHLRQDLERVGRGAVAAGNRRWRVRRGNSGRKWVLCAVGVQTPCTSHDRKTRAG